MSYHFSKHELFSVRELHADLIGQLETIKGTVTRTSVVRPELLFGCFQCSECQEMYPNIQQQFVYTTVRTACCRIFYISR